MRVLVLGGYEPVGAAVVRKLRSYGTTRWLRGRAQSEGTGIVVAVDGALRTAHLRP